MKIRNGFVSNSSSASFIVLLTENPYHPEKDTNELCLKDKEKYRWLVDREWKVTACAYPSKIEHDSKHHDQPILEDLGPNALYFKTCINWEEIAQDLINQKIPFIASVHYGHETVVYSPTRGEVYHYPNYGYAFETYRDLPTEVISEERAFVLYQLQPGCSVETEAEFLVDISYGRKQITEEGSDG